MFLIIVNLLERKRDVIPDEWQSNDIIDVDNHWRKGDESSENIRSDHQHAIKRRITDIPTQDIFVPNSETKIASLQERCEILETANKALDEKMTALQEEMRALKKEKIKADYREFKLKYENWTYPLEDLQVEALMNLGYDEFEASMTRKFARYLKRLTTAIRRCNDSCVDITSCPEEFLSHNDVLLPHWQEFSNSLTHHRRIVEFLDGEDDFFVDLQIIDIQLSNEVLNILGPALNHAPFKTVSFTTNQFGSAGVDFAINFVENSSVLRDFTWVGNPFHSREDLTRLCEAISICPSLNSISIGNNDSESDLNSVLLRSNKSKNLATLDFDGNTFQI